MLKLVTAPNEGPVSLDQLKGHIRNTQPTEDADLSLKLDAASSWMRDELGRPLITSTWDLCLDAWPRPGWINLPCNTQSVESIKYTDSGGVDHTLDPAAYRLARAYDPARMGDWDCGPARLYLSYGQSWPSPVLRIGEPIVVRLVAGWADAASVPAPIKNAILMTAEHLWRNRSAVIADRGVVSEEIALGVQRLTAAYQDRRY